MPRLVQCCRARSLVCSRIAAISLQLCAPRRRGSKDDCRAFEHSHRAVVASHRSTSLSSAMSSAAAPAAAPSAPVNRPLVGVGVLIVDPVNHAGCVLVGERKGSHGAATMAPPGGHLEYGESWNDCGLREVKEETNLDLVAPLAHVYTTNAVFPEVSKHYVTLFLKSTIAPDSGPLQTLEPEKCVGWQWMQWTELRRRHRAKEIKLFNTMIDLIEDESFVI